MSALGVTATEITHGEEPGAVPGIMRKSSYVVSIAREDKKETQIGYFNGTHGDPYVLLSDLTCCGHRKIGLMSENLASMECFLSFSKAEPVCHQVWLEMNNELKRSATLFLRQQMRQLNSLALRVWMFRKLTAIHELLKKPYSVSSENDWLARIADRSEAPIAVRT